MPYDCTDGPLSPAMTGLDPGEIPTEDEIWVAPGTAFARDCTKLVVAPMTLTIETMTAGAGADATPAPRSRKLPTVPVWAVMVCYVEKCLPVPGNNGNPPPLDVYNPASCAYIRHATGIWLGVTRAVKAGADCLFSPGFLGTCVPPPELYPEPIDNVTGCGGLEVGPLTFKGPSADVAWAEFTVTWQWGGA